jgi:N-acetylglutamate synthase-like GNAT family acetyltransferase
MELRITYTISIGTGFLSNMGFHETNANAIPAWRKARYKMKSNMGKESARHGIGQVVYGMNIFIALQEQ